MVSTSRSTCSRRRSPAWSTSRAPSSRAASSLRMGNSHPSLFPYEPLPCADGELIITAGNNGQFRRPVEGARRTGAGRRPAVPRQRDRTANREELRACSWWTGCGPARRWSGSANHRRGRALRSDQHRRRRRRVRRGGRARSRVRHGRRPSRPCATRSRSPAAVVATELPPPGWTSTAPRSATPAGWRDQRTTHDDPPDLAVTSSATRSACSDRTSPPTSWQGRVR